MLHKLRVHIVSKAQMVDRIVARAAAEELFDAGFLGGGQIMIVSRAVQDRQKEHNSGRFQ